MLIRFASGLVYYGIVFSSPNLGDNPFISYSISCIIDFPCLFPLLFLFSYVGRVLPLSIGNFTGGALFLLTIGTYYSEVELDWGQAARLDSDSLKHKLIISSAQIYPILLMHTILNIVSKNIHTNIFDQFFCCNVYLKMNRINTAIHNIFGLVQCGML